MPSIAKVAVPVHHKHLHGKIAQNLVHVYGLLEIFSARQYPQRFDQSLLIGGRGFEFGIFKDARIAVRVVVYVLEGNIVVRIVERAVIRLIQLAMVAAKFLAAKASSGSSTAKKRPQSCPLTCSQT